MNIKEFTNYMLNYYNHEVIETYYDAKGAKKNRFKNKEKAKELEKSAETLFSVNNLYTELKPGMEFNRSENPWIQIHDEKNKKGTHGEYIGVSFNKKEQSLEIWLGFGRTNPRLKKKEVAQKRASYIEELKIIEPNLNNDFQYVQRFDEAVMISKSIKLEDITDKKVIEDLDYLASIYIAYENQEYFNKKQQLKKEEAKNLEKDSKIMGRNILYKGFPGSGKSYEVKKEYLTQKDKNGQPILDEFGDLKLINEYKYETIVFYKEYSNANFVGNIMPVVQNGNVTYDFIPGPFTKILKRAIHHPESNFYLIIEEINRGNAAAIFGDIFLLLDRKGPNQESIYKISNELLAQEVFGHKDQKIYLPANLSIIATMNSSDQNTIELDSAFERRWETIWITDRETELDKLYIKGLGNVKWGSFRKVINNYIANPADNSEDKKLGSYFIDPTYLSEIPKNGSKELERFIFKVFTYLYQKVCIFNKSLFKKSIKSVDELINEGLKKGIQIFNDEIINEIENYEYNNN